MWTNPEDFSSFCFCVNAFGFSFYFFNYLLIFTLPKWLSERWWEGGVERKWIFWLVFHSPDTCNIKSGSSQCQEPERKSCFLTWVAGTHIWIITCYVPSCASTGCYIENRSGTNTRNSDTGSRFSKHCFNDHTNFLILILKCSIFVILLF